GLPRPDTGRARRKHVRAPCASHPARGRVGGGRAETRAVARRLPRRHHLAASGAPTDRAGGLTPRIWAHAIPTRTPTKRGHLTVVVSVEAVFSITAMPRTAAPVIVIETSCRRRRRSVQPVTRM